MTFKSNLLKIGMTLIILSLPVIFFILLLYLSYKKFGYVDFNYAASKSWVFFILISIIAVPGLLLHIKYIKIEKGRFLIFNKRLIEVSKGEFSTRILYKDILKAEIYFVVWNRRNPWSGYGFTRIFLKDGTRLLYTSLVFDCFSSALLFKQNSIDVEELETLWPWPKKI